MKKTPEEAIKLLIESKKQILAFLKKTLDEDDSLNYRTFGTNIEDYLSPEVIKIFRKGGFIKKESDYVEAPNKNHFPDFELKTTSSLALDFKSGNRSRKTGNRWVSTNNSNNDLGTLNSWPKKIGKFGGDNIYFLFIIYNINNKKREILDIQIDPFYKFLGLTKTGVIKYREKDGNLRPRDFYKEPLITSKSQFCSLFKKTIMYRSEKIIKKHRKILKSTDEIVCF